MPSITKGNTRILNEQIWRMKNMNTRMLCLLIMLVLFSTGTIADDKDQQAQLDEVKEQIKAGQETNQMLKDDLTARDKEVADLKQKLKELEAKTKK